VSTIEAVATDLAAVSNGLDRARQAAAAADDTAQRIATQAAGAGFTGIAQNLARLRAAIREIQTGIAATGGPAGEASAAVAAAPRQATPKETLGVLEPVTQKLDDTHTAIAAVLESVTRAQQLAAAGLQGGQPGPMLARLDAIRETMLAVAERNNLAKQHVTEALAAARDTGKQGN
jgi:hypothetical protein